MSLKELCFTCRSGIRLAKLYEVLTGSPPLLGKGGECDPPLYLHPVTDQQRMGNVTTVLAKLAAVGAVPPEGKVRLKITDPPGGVFPSASVRATQGIGQQLPP